MNYSWLSLLNVSIARLTVVCFVAKSLHRSEASVEFSLLGTFFVFLCKSLYCFAN